MTFCHLKPMTMGQKNEHITLLKQLQGHIFCSVMPPNVNIRSQVIRSQIRKMYFNKTMFSNMLSVVNVFVVLLVQIGCNEIF